MGYNDPINYNTGKIISDLLLGIAVLLGMIIIVCAVFGTPLYIATKNTEKVKDMTEACIAKGYDGWKDVEAGVANNYEASSFCYNYEAR